MKTMLFKMKERTVKPNDYEDDLKRYDGHIALVSGLEADDNGLIEVEFSDGIQYSVYVDELHELPGAEHIDTSGKVKVYVYRLSGITFGKLTLEVTETEAKHEYGETYKIPMSINAGSVQLNTVVYSGCDEGYDEEAYYISTEQRDDMEEYLKAKLHESLLRDKQRFIDMFDEMLKLFE